MLVAPGGELPLPGAVDAGRVLGPARGQVVPRVGGDVGQFDGLSGALEQCHGPSLFSFVTNDKVVLSLVRSESEGR